MGSATNAITQAHWPKGGVGKPLLVSWAVLVSTYLLWSLSMPANSHAAIEDSSLTLLQQATAFLRGRSPEKAREVLEKAVAADPRSADAWGLLGDAYSQLGLGEKAQQSYETTIRLNPQAARALYNLGILELNQNQFAAAAEHLSAFRHQRPGDREVLFPLAHCLFQVGRRSEAQQVLISLVNGPGRSWETNFKAGQLYLANGEQQSAIPLLEKALRLQPGDEEVRLTLAMAESSLGRHEKVVDLLHANQNRPTGRFLLGTAFSSLGRDEDAIPLLEEAVRVEPTEKSWVLALARSYSGASRVSDAVRILRKAYNEWPKDSEVRIFLAQELLRGGGPSEALAVLNSAGAGPRSPVELEISAKAYVALGQLDEAERAAQQAVDKGDARESSLILLANILQLQGRSPEVLTLLERHRQKYLQSAAYSLTLGTSYFSTGNYKVAQGLFEKAVSIDPSLAQAQYLLGNTLSSLGKPEIALNHYESALRLNPDNSLYHMQLGLVLSILGKTDGAEQHLKRSVEVNGMHAPARYELARVFVASSRDDLAREQLERAIDVDPEFESSYYLLSQVYGRLGMRDEAARVLKMFREIQGRRHETERALKQTSSNRLQ